MNEFETVMLIQLARNYDVMLAFLAAIAPDKALEIVDIHSQGQFLGPIPALELDTDVTDE